MGSPIASRRQSEVRPLTAPSLIPADERAGHSAAVSRACAALGVASADDLRRVATASAVTEVAYKVGEETAWAQRFRDALPEGMCDIETVAASQPHCAQRYVVCEGAEAVYVGFMGTKVTALGVCVCKTPSSMH